SSTTPTPTTNGDVTTRRQDTGRSTTSGAPGPPPPEAPAPPAPPGPRSKTFLVGTVDDSLVQQDAQFAQSQADLSRDAGFDTAVVSAMWQHGQRAAPARLDGGAR